MSRLPLIEAVERPAAPTVQPRAAAGNRWYEIRNETAADEAEVMIYDDIGGWFGTYADEFVEELRGITAPRMRVRINSPGGSVFEGIAIANALRLHPADVTVQIDGIAASIASVIAMAGDRVVMMPQSQLMIHDASGLCMGNATDMAEMAALLDRQSDNIADVYATRAGGTREEWRERMRAETWYLAGEAVAAGLADEAVPAGKAPAEPAAQMTNSWDLSVFRYAGRSEAPAPVVATGGVVEGAAPSDAGETGTDCAVPTAPAGERPSLVIDIGSVLGEEAVERLRQAVAGPTADNQAPVPDAEPAAPAPTEPAAPADGWADLTAHLTAPPADPWAAATAHLIPTEAPLSSSTATDA